MTKKIVFMAVMIFAVLVVLNVAGVVKAQGSELNLADAVNSTDEGGTLTLQEGGNYTVNNTVTINKNITIDLNGATVVSSTSGQDTIKVEKDKKVTFKDSQGGGTVKNTGNDIALWVNGEAILEGGTFTNTSATYGAIQVGTPNNGGAKGTLIVKSGATINAEHTAIVLAGDESNVEINGGDIEAKDYAINSAVKSDSGLLKNQKITISGGTIKSSKYGIAVFGEQPELVVSGGTIEASSFAISGNGSASGDNQTKDAKITISGGTITSTGTAAIYHPNTGTLTVKGTATVEGKVGIVARQGTINIEGGKIIGTEAGSGQVGDAKEDSSNVNLPFGAAIVVDNKSTGYSGAAKVNISDGILNSVDENTSPVMSYTGKNQDNDQGNKTDFAISGGEFSSPFNAELITGNAAEVSIEKSGDTRYYVGKTAEEAVNNAEVGSHVKVEHGTLEIASLPSGVTVEGPVTVTNPSSSGDTVDTIKNNLQALVIKAEGEDNASAELTNAIAEARKVLGNAGATYSELKEAYEKLQQAYDNFKNGIVTPSENQNNGQSSTNKGDKLDDEPKMGENFVVPAMCAAVIAITMVVVRKRNVS